MKKIYQFLIIAILISFVSCSSNKTDQSSASAFKFDTTSLSSGGEFYQCPMHPEVLSAKPGDCPDCGMALEKMVKQ